MIYKAKHPQFIQALQYKDLDKHSTDFQITRIQQVGLCNACRKPLTSHGFLNNNLICPSSYIIYQGSIVSNILTQEQFETSFEPVGEVVSIV